MTHYLPTTQETSPRLVLAEQLLSRFTSTECWCRSSRSRFSSSAGAKALVDGAPKAVLEGAKKEVAEDAKAKLEAAGAKVTLK